MENGNDKFSNLDKIDPSTQNLIKNLMPLSDNINYSTDLPLKHKTQTKDKNISQNMSQSQYKKGSFSVLEKEKINDTICEYALSNDLSTEQIITYLKTNNIEKKNSIFNLDLDDKDSLLYHLSQAVPSRSINSIIKYILNRYCHFDEAKNGNNKNKPHINCDEEKEPMYTSHKTKEKKEDKISSELSSFVHEEKRSPLIIQMALLQAIQYFLDQFLENNVKGYKLIKNNYEFVPKNNLNEKEYKLDLIEGNIIRNEDLKESKDHQTNIFYIKTSFDLGVVFKIHYDKIKLDWVKLKEIYNKNIPEEDQNLYDLNEEEIEEEWKKLLKEYKVEEICKIRQDKKMIKE